MEKEIINYSQSWEDPQILTEALAIEPADRVLSITSGGDNTLALMLKGAGRVDSIDINPAQNYLLELKIGAAKNLTYEEYLGFLGARTLNERGGLLERVTTGISPEARIWASNHMDLVEMGLIHCGRFERFSSLFARRVLPLVHSKREISQLLSIRNIDEQKKFYESRWDTWRWRFLFGLASSRVMLKRYARQRGMFAYETGQTVANIYQRRLERHLVSVPTQGNHFLRYLLTGRYEEDLPPYLTKNGYQHVREIGGSRVSIVANSVYEHLRSLSDNTYSKFYLSDIFEALSPEQNTALWGEIIRTAKPGAVVAYWNNLVERTYPPDRSALFKTDEENLRKLRAKDRVFFYDRFFAHTIQK